MKNGLRYLKPFFILYIVLYKINAGPRIQRRDDLSFQK